MICRMQPSAWGNVQHLHDSAAHLQEVQARPPYEEYLSAGLLQMLHSASPLGWNVHLIASLNIHWHGRKRYGQNIYTSVARHETRNDKNETLGSIAGIPGIQFLILHFLESLNPVIENFAEPQLELCCFPGSCEGWSVWHRAGRGSEAETEMLVWRFYL